MQKTPIDHTYLHSYLIKAGIRFDFNIVDTVCNRKFSATFYLVLITALLILSVPQGMPGNPVPEANEAAGIEYVGISSSTKLMYYIIVSCLGAWLAFYLLRLGYYLALRTKLRNDPAPLSVEAYAVVCLDIKTRPVDYLYQLFSIICGKGKNGFCRYAVIYKEIGTEHPRFFLTAAVPARKLCFIPDHIGRVFPHRKKSNLYTLDDKSSYQTVSARRSVMGKFAVNAGSMACSKPDTKATQAPTTVDTKAMATNSGASISISSPSTGATISIKPDTHHPQH